MAELSPTVAIEEDYESYLKRREEFQNYAARDAEITATLSKFRGKTTTRNTA